MKDKLITVIIPTYNRAGRLKFAMKSVLNQTYTNFELIIVDDGSKDNTKEVIETFNDNRIKYIWQEHSGLPAVARNTGLKNANGEYIAFLDSDDIWFHNKLKRQIEIITQKKKVLLIATNAIIFNNKFHYIGNTNNQKDKFVSYDKLLDYNIIVNSTVLFKKLIIDKIGYLDDNPLAVGIEDFDYWLRILEYRNNSIFITKEILCYYRKEESSLLRSISPIKSYLRHKYISSKHKKYKEEVLIERAKLSLKKKILLNLEGKKISIFKVLKLKYLYFDEKILLITTYFNRIKRTKKLGFTSKFLIAIIQIFLIGCKHIIVILEKILSTKI